MAWTERTDLVKGHSLCERSDLELKMMLWYGLATIVGKDMGKDSGKGGVMYEGKDKGND